MGTTNRTNNFVTNIKNKIKNFFRSSDQKVHTQNAIAKSDTEASLSKDKRTTRSYSSKGYRGTPWWTKIYSIGNSKRKLLPVNYQPLKTFGTFSPIKPIYPWRNK